MSRTMKKPLQEANQSGHGSSGRGELPARFQVQRPGRMGLLVFSILSLTIGSILLILSGQSSVPVERFEVSGNHYLDREEILAIAGIRPGQILNGKDLDMVSHRLTAQPPVKKAHVEMESGGLLRIELEERGCGAILQVRDHLYDVDRELVILSTDRVRCKDVPVITGHFQMDQGEFRDPRLLSLLAALERGRSLYPELITRISGIHLIKGGMTLFIARSQIRVELKGSLDEENIRRLYASLSYFEKEHGTSGLIDLRGADAILVPEL